MPDMVAKGVTVGKSYKYKLHLSMWKYIDIRRIISLWTLIAFWVSFFISPLSFAYELALPAPGTRVTLSPTFNPPILKGIKVNPNNPFRFEFILDQGDKSFFEAERESIPAKKNYLKSESTKLIKYFLASLTTPENDLWVNLSPYEKDRIIPNSFGQTEMGRDLLAQDYMLKQITASLIYPEDETGKKFWKRVYEESVKKFGSTNIPINTFNKVWIIPEKAVVYENTKAGTAYVVESKLKVMLEEDYLAFSNNVIPAKAGIHHGPPIKTLGGDSVSNLGSQIVREVVLPELTKEINEGKNFAQLRQVYNSLILATWYKKKIKDSILNQVYSDKNKVLGLNAYRLTLNLPTGRQALTPQQIYQNYIQSFKKGAYNYIKDTDIPNGISGPRKYFAGGCNLKDLGMTAGKDSAMVPVQSAMEITVNLIVKDPHGLKRLVSGMQFESDNAMIGNNIVPGNVLWNKDSSHGVRTKILLKLARTYFDSEDY